MPGIKGLLQKEVDIPSAEPTFGTLEALATTLRHTDETKLEDSQEMILKLDDTAEQLLVEVEATEERTHIPYASLSQIWSAAKAWDVARTEATEGLMSHLIEHSAALTAQVALNKAFKNAQRTGRPFEEELDRYNETQRVA
jgi:hypothetical protein